MAEETPTSSQEGLSSSPHSSDERTWAAIAHASGLLNLITGFAGLLVAALIWLDQKEKSKWVAFHGLQSLVFQGAVLLIGAVIALFSALFTVITGGCGGIITLPLLILVGLGLFICLLYSAYGAYQIYDGKEFRYQWIGDWIEERSFDEPIE
jgi:uncharacterized Tic20 family protein